MNVIITGGAPISGFAGRVALAGDAHSYPMLGLLCDYLHECGIAYTNLGQRDVNAAAAAVCEAVLSGACSRGIVVTCQGNDAVLALNKHLGVRCALGDKPTRVTLGRRENDVNTLAIATDTTAFGVAMESVWKFLAEPFAGGVFARRNADVAALDDMYARGDHGCA